MVASGKAHEVSLGVTMATQSQDSLSYDFTLASHPQQGYRVKREEICIKVYNNEPVTINRQGKKLTATWKNKKYPIKAKGTNGVIEDIDWQGPAGLFNAFFRLTEENPLDESLPVGGTLVLDYQPLPYAMRQFLRTVLIYSLNPSQLRSPQKLSQETPFNENGENLSAVLRELHRDKQVVNEIQRIISRLIPDITDFSISTTGSYLVTYLHYKNAAGKIRKSDLGQESDGTLRVLGILAALYQRPERILHRDDMHQLLIIEEPEVHIHPGMLAVLADSFREASLHHQILLTTHSPDLLDFLPPESFLVVEKVNGETTVGPLATNQLEVVQKRLFTSGELLRMEGLHRQPMAPSTLADSE
jgi:AAA15 family ATPase/GTPase